MSIERSDKKKNIDKVTASLLKNPLQSEREVARDTGLSNGTAHNIKKEIEQKGAKDDRIISLTDKDFELMKQFQLEKLRRMTEEKEKVNNSDIDRWDNTATKRYTIFRGDVTDNEGGLKNMKDCSDEELDKIING